MLYSMEFNDEGTENSGELVSIGGKLPLLRELRTSQLLDFFVWVGNFGQGGQSYEQVYIKS